MSEVIEAVEAVEPDVVADAIEAVKEEAPTEEVVETPEVETVEVSEPVVDTPFPKKAVNALSRRDRTIAKLKAENHRLMNQEKIQPEAPNETPKEDDFETYGEFISATNKFDMDKRFADYEKKQGETKQSEQNDQWIAERAEAVSKQADKAIAEIPDYMDVLEQNNDIIDVLPPEVQNLFLETENAPLAFYTMAKDGSLEGLMSMSPMQAAVAIGRAAERGSSPAPVKISKAPAPMKASAGSGDNSNNPVNMSPDKLAAYFGVD